MSVISAACEDATVTDNGGTGPDPASGDPRPRRGDDPARDVGPDSGAESPGHAVPDSAGTASADREAEGAADPDDSVREPAAGARPADEVEPAGGRRPPGRAGLGMRDMIGALVVLLAIAGVVAAVTRGCSFDPGAPATDQGSVPSVDVSAKLSAAASSVAFSVRQPVVPGGWRANSSSTAPVGSGSGADVVVRVGWLTAGGRYVQLSQSGGDAGDVVATETGMAPGQTDSVSVDGVSWAVYPSRRDEVAWVASLGGAVVLITGNATEDEFHELATAVAAAKPLS